MATTAPLNPSALTGTGAAIIGSLAGADGMHMHGDTYHQRRNERHDGERALDDV